MSGLGQAYGDAWRRQQQRDQIAELRKALAELLDAFDICPDDLPAHEYEAIVDDAKSRARKLVGS